MKPIIHSIRQRMSLRVPQEESLRILSQVCELLSLEKSGDLKAALNSIHSHPEFEKVTDFERDFPSLCFALATGVGKTRLMGAFISYLYLAEGVRNFFILAPNLTIYDKLIRDFTPNTPKYVFQGIPELASSPPEIITGDNYESGRGVRDDDIRERRLFSGQDLKINIFNISKINSEVRGGKSPRIKRLSEFIGESYFDYLSKLDDLVLIMDESHRYRASAGVKAINELKPILGLELTATPQVESGTKSVAFQNVIYRYPLSAALKDGYVKEPAVATRENFNVKNYSKDNLERLKLEDGVRIHENTKIELEVYARQNNRPVVKPFMLVVAEDTEHADEIAKTIADDSFFQGRYKGRVITVHSNKSGEEKDDTVQQLLSVEDRANPTEIVIHVNMLKEGWDVTNLYTVVPLRAANSKTLVEQSIGRGLRLPYGKRVGVPAIDRLTIVSHDKFQEIVDEANRSDSIIRLGVIIGKDIPETGMRLITAQPLIFQELEVGKSETSSVGGKQKPKEQLFRNEDEIKVARETLSVIEEFERLPSSADLLTPEVQKEITQRVQYNLSSLQTSLPMVADSGNVAQVVEKTIRRSISLSIDIPRIVVVPKGDVKAGFREFNLDVSNVRLQPVAKEILIQHLHDHSRYRLFGGHGANLERRLEDYLVFGLIDFDDVSYDDHADLLYKLSGQLVTHLKAYLKDDEEVRNVLQFHNKQLIELIHAQMQAHYIESSAGYEVRVSKGFKTFGPSVYSTPCDAEIRNFREPVDDKIYIRGIVFEGFIKCLMNCVKFDSDSERRFSVILEDDREVIKWIRPNKNMLQIDYKLSEPYEPDFVAETENHRYLCEVKRRSDLEDEDVKKKAQAAELWCQHASKHGGKPWSYLLIPHDTISENMNLAGFAI